MYQGHACQEELKLIYSLVKPKYAIPVHGEYRHLKANAGVATSLGIPKENVFIIQSGDVLELCDESAKVVDKVHTGAILVDGLGVGDVGNIVLRDRQHLAGRWNYYRCPDTGTKNEPSACRNRILFPEDLYMSVSQNS